MTKKIKTKQNLTLLIFVKKIVILTYKIFTAVFADEFSFRPVTVYLPHMQLVRVRSPVFPKQNKTRVEQDYYLYETISCSQPVLLIRIGFNADPDPACYLKTDPDSLVFI